MPSSLPGVWGADRGLRGREGGPPALAARLHGGDQGPQQSVRHCGRVSSPECNFKEECPQKNSFETVSAKWALHELCVSSRLCISVTELQKRQRTQRTALSVTTPHGHSWRRDKPFPQKPGLCGGRPDACLCRKTWTFFPWWSRYRWRSIQITRLQKNQCCEWRWKSKQNSYGRSDVLMDSSFI